MVVFADGKFSLCYLFIFLSNNLCSHDGDDKKRPVIIHRAILGSVERMIAILTENYGGKWFVNNQFKKVDLWSSTILDFWHFWFIAVLSDCSHDFLINRLEMEAWQLSGGWAGDIFLHGFLADGQVSGLFFNNQLNANMSSSVSGLCGSLLVKWWLYPWAQPVKSMLRK